MLAQGLHCKVKLELFCFFASSNPITAGVQLAMRHDFIFATYMHTLEKFEELTDLSFMYTSEQDGLSLGVDILANVFQLDP